MPVDKAVIHAGNGKDHPQAGDTITVDYTGWLHDQAKGDDHFRGEQFDQGDKFESEIGKRKLIPGWEESLPDMSLGEKSRLTIPPDLAYGKRGFPGFVPANATLIFELKLVGINEKMIGSETGVESSSEAARVRKDSHVQDLYD